MWYASFGCLNTFLLVSALFFWVAAIFNDCFVLFWCKLCMLIFTCVCECMVFFLIGCYLYTLWSLHLYRQSSKDESLVHGGSQNYETTFDVDGNVETVSTSSQKDDTRSQRSVSSREGNRYDLTRCLHLTSFGLICKFFRIFVGWTSICTYNMLNMQILVYGHIVTF